MAPWDSNANVIFLPGPQPLPPLPPLAVAAQLPSHAGADALMLVAAPPPPERPEDPAGSRSTEGRPRPHLGALQRSQSNEQRIVVVGRRGDPANARRVLPSADGSVADAAAIVVPVGTASTLKPKPPEQNVLFVRGRPEVGPHCGGTTVRRKPQVRSAH